jgi:hypothetical protein
MSSDFGVVNTSTDWLVPGDDDARERTMGKIKDYLDIFHPTLDGVVVAIYARPSKIGSILLSDARTQENTWQGKTGLIVKMGPDAFVDKPEKDIIFEQKAKVGDWVCFSVQDGWIMQIAGVFCRFLRDRSIKMVLDRPDVVY